MSRYTKLLEEVLDSFFEGYTYDPKAKKIRVLDEAAAQKASRALSKLVLEKSRDLWGALDNASSELRQAGGEIDFQTMNADPSRMGRSPMDQVNANDSTDPMNKDPMGGQGDQFGGEMGDEMGMGMPGGQPGMAAAPPAMGGPAMGESRSLKQMFKVPGFNFDDLFEDEASRLPMDDKPAQVQQKTQDKPLDEDEFGGEGEPQTDGADDFEDMQIGQDDAGLGGGSETNPGDGLGRAGGGDMPGGDIGGGEGDGGFDFDLIDLGGEGGGDLNGEPVGDDGLGDVGGEGDFGGDESGGEPAMSDGDDEKVDDAAGKFGGGAPMESRRPRRK